MPRLNRARVMVPVVFVVWMVAIAGFDVVAPTGAEPTATAGPMARTAGPEAVAAADPPNATVAGEDVLADQLERVQEVAAANDLSIDEVRRILSDPAAYVAKDDSIFYVEPRPDPPASPADDPAMGDALALSETFKLHTRPGSSRTIFLDFDGHTISGTSWTVDDSGSFTALPFDPDDQPGFAAEDLQAIQQIWQVVAEDYASFDVDVTTEDPGVEKLRRSTADDTAYGTRVVITDNTDADIVPGFSAGGVAFLDSFDAIGAQHDQRQPAWVFGSMFGSNKQIGEVVSHEAGHTVGLEHDGTTNGVEYYPGHGVWAPIMGVAYQRPIGQWSKGEYTAANNAEDDFTTMASHGLVARTDDHTNALATATTLVSSIDGTISTSSDQDLFKYVAPASGTWNFRADAAAEAPNLDIKLTLLSAAGTQLAQNNPAVVEVDQETVTGMDASISTSVTAGSTYYVRVEPSSFLTPQTGYSTYSSIGAYTVSASSGPTCSSQDTREPNDRFDTASVATSGQLITSRTCRGDVDYYGITALQGQTINASLLFTHAQGDLNATLLDPTGVAVASGSSTTDDEALSHVAAKTGNYVLEVAGKAGVANTYSLTLTSPLCPPDDSLENNDTLGTAKPIQAGVWVAAVSCPSDADFYSFALRQDQSVDVELTHVNRYAPVTVQLVSSTGAVLDEDLNEFDQDELRVSHYASTADTVRIRVIPGTRGALYALRAESSPAAPSAVTATAGPGSATVSWTEPTSNGGQPISQYLISAFVGTNEVASAYVDNKPGVIGHLDAGVAHTFTVQAINSRGTGARSAPSNVVTPLAPLVPGAPGTATAVALDGKVALNWNPPSSDGGADITEYVVTPYVGATARPTQSFDGFMYGGTVTGLTNGTTYTFRVAAKNVAGTGPQSPASAAVTPFPVPGAPTAVTAASGYQSATVSWTAPAPNSAKPISGYAITVYADGAQYTELLTFGTATTETIDLWADASYTFRVAARNDAGTGATSSLSNAVRPGTAPTAPRAPTFVQADAVDAVVSLYWAEPVDNGSPITGYVVTPYIGAAAQTARTFNSTSTSQTLTGLVIGTTYTFKVAAKNAIGTGPQSAATGPVTLTTVPGAPTAASAVAGNAQATVSWTAPASNGGLPITGYEVVVYSGGLEQGSMFYEGPQTSALVTGLINGNSYTFRVRAGNQNGTGAPSNATNAVTPAATATVPGVATGVTGVAGNAQVTVSWTAPTSNGGSAITGYVVTPYIGATAQTATSTSGTGTSKAITGLANGTAYTFRVAAKNAVGTGAQSAASSSVTPLASVNPFAPFASWSALVTRQYVDLTTKSPTSSELSSWVSQLNAGTKTKGDLDDALRRGPENLSNVDPVVRVYRAFLGRAPDAGGLQFWIKRRRNVAPAKTWTVTQIATEFTNSNEFKTKYGSLTNRQFVTRIYTDVLGRTADAAGVNYWTGKLDRKEKTKAQVMVGFSESNEYKTKQAQNTDVAVAYIYLLGRAPTAAEALDWVTRQKAGTSHPVLLGELLATSAYAQRITG